MDIFLAAFRGPRLISLVSKVDGRSCASAPARPGPIVYDPRRSTLYTFCLFLKKVIYMVSCFFRCLNFKVTHANSPMRLYRLLPIANHLFNNHLVLPKKGSDRMRIRFFFVVGHAKTSNLSTFKTC